MSVTSKAAARAGRAQRVAQPYPVPAPIGGLNTKDALANMPETDAVLLDNLFCQPTWVETRGGSATLATFTGTPQTLLPYAGIVGGELFAAVGASGTNSIFRVDNAAGGSAGAAVVGGAGNTVQHLSAPYFDYEQFGTSAAEVLLALNGVDLPLLYDGTTWYPLANSGGTYQLTGAPSSNPALLSQVAVYKQRLWFIQGNSLNVYYLAQATFAGALTQLNLAGYFKLGGSIAAVITVSIDNTAGTNDYIAFLSNQGECLMFQGYDPSAVATWSLAAHFRMGAPIGTGRQCWQKIGMDALILCQDGFVMLSDAMLTDRSQVINKLSDKIRFGVIQNVRTYGTYPGWQAMLYPPGNKLIVNVPTNSNPATMGAFQYVMNTLTGAWSTWGFSATPLGATCFENFNNKLYYGKTGSVQQGDTGASDNGANITWYAQQAFNYLGEKTLLKRLTQVQPFLNTAGAYSVGVATLVDFKTTAPVFSTCPLLSGNNFFWFGAQGIGYAASLNLTASTAVSTQWEMTNWMFEPGGAFYGK